MKTSRKLTVNVVTIMSIVFVTPAIAIGCDYEDQTKTTDAKQARAQAQSLAQAPYATQYSAPEKDTYVTTSSSVHHNVPQAEPNGLFMPVNAEGTWIMLVDPAGGGPKPVYVEPRAIVSPFRLKDQECAAEIPAPPSKGGK